MDHATGIDEPAVYLCHGFMLVVGSVATHQFNRLQTDLLDPLKSAGRPIETMLAASPEPLLYQDLPVWPWPDPAI